MSSWGPPAGSPFSGQSAAASSARSGLPFAGIPSELLDKVERIAGDEPDHPHPAVSFDPVAGDGPPFTLRSFLGTHRSALAFALFLVIVETLSMQVGPLLTQIGIDRGIVPGNFDVLVVVSAVYLGVIVMNTLAGWARISWTGRLGERLMYELRVKVFSHLQRLSLDFFTGEKAGRLMTRMTSDIEALTQLFEEGLVQMAVQGLTIIVITVIMFVLNPTLAAITVFGVMPVLLLLTLWFRRASDRGYTLVRDRIAEVLADLQESLSGIRIIAAHNRRRHNVINHTNIVGEHLDANLYTARVGAIYGPGSEMLGILAQAAIVLVGGRMVLSGSLTIGELTAFILYLTMFFAPIQQLVQLYNSYQQGQAAVAKLRDLLGTRPTVSERPGALELPPIRGQIELRAVSFGYEPDRAVLKEVDLCIEEGETFALVGPTGAGKSTIAKLVTRFYDPDSGSVLIDGHDLRDLTLHSLRNQLGVVPQEPFLFHGSIRDNIAFADPGATDEEVMEACRAVGIAELIARLPEGLDTLCHERGISLSSGERQLLALARAFMAKPRVLVLDEATSNLDLRSEHKIEQALDRLLGGRTAILIAHRLATAMRADRIAVIDDGRVIQLGSHEQLVGQKGTYAAMFETWMSHA